MGAPNWNDPRFISVRDGINNNPASTWKAAIHTNIPYDNQEALHRLVGAKINTVPTKTINQSDAENTARQTQSVPASYDLRTLYPNCWSIGFARNQFACGSCFAVSTMVSLSDRFCIKAAKANTFAQRSFSFQDLLECCTNKVTYGQAPYQYSYLQCGYGPQAGCNGGDPYGAFDYAATTGVSTGENAGNFTNCKPYSWSGFTSSSVVAPRCSTTCGNSLIYRTSYVADRMKIKTANLIRGTSTADTVLKAQQAIMNFGTIVAAYTVYVDFYYYSSGVYQSNQDPATQVGGHAVKVVGWGVSNGIPYWIAGNSWGTRWGMNGFFWILRGQNHCNFEGYLTEGILN